MTPRRAAPQDPVEARLDEVARLLALLLKRDRPLSEAIAEMAGVGFGQKRISELVGTSAGYVDNVVTKSRKGASKTARRTKSKRSRVADG